MTSKRTVALVRVSTNEQSVESQRQEIERWAAARGAPVDQWFTEEGVSGASKRREVLDQVLAQVRRRRVGVVVVAELSRLSRRGLGHVAAVLDELRAAEVTLVSLREGLDSSTPMGRAMMGMASIFAELERDRIRDRVRAGMARAKAQGKTVGRPRLVWREEEIEELRGLLDAGASLRQIERDAQFRVFDDRGRPRTPSARSMAEALRAIG